MSVDLRMPNITAATEKEQLAQIRSYLYQFIPQLQWALNNIETASSQGYVVQQTTRVKETTTAPSSAGVNFNDLKALIIKSADIVEAYYEEISQRLEGLYVAESDFGTYAEQTAQVINQNSSYVEQLLGNVQTIQSNIDGFNDKILESQAHIRSGTLYYDDEGFPVVGLEIGQRKKKDGEEVFDQFARFTADKLSFYDKGGKELAYISDDKLYINKVEIKSIGTTDTDASYKIGGYVDMVSADGGVVTKWVGGNA